jgi:hypothetical protein
MHPVTMTHGNDGRAARRLFLKETIHRAIMLCRFHLELEFLWDWREYPYRKTLLARPYIRMSISWRLDIDSSFYGPAIQGINSRISTGLKSKIERA